MSPTATQDAYNKAGDAKNSAAELAGQATEKVKANVKAATESAAEAKDNVVGKSYVSTGKAQSGELKGDAERKSAQSQGILSTATNYALDTALSAGQSAAELAGSITQRGLNTVSSAASLALGAGVTATELSVGAVATLYDAAGNVVNRGVETVQSVQHRGQDVTHKTADVVRGTIHGVSVRGENVINRTTGKTVELVGHTGQAGAEGLSKGIETTGQIATQVKDATLEIGGQAIQKAQELAQIPVAVVSDTAETAQQMSADALSKGKAMTESVVDATQEVSQQLVDKGRSAAQLAEQKGQQLAASAKDTAGAVASEGEEIAESAERNAPAKQTNFASTAPIGQKEDTSKGSRSMLSSVFDNAMQHYEIGKQKEAKEQQAKK